MKSLLANRKSLSRPAVLAASIATLLLAASPAVNAASATWSGAADANWSGLNWGGLATPGVGDTATFSGAGNANTTINVGTISLSKIVFDTASAAAYTLGTSAGTGTITFADGTTTAVDMLSTVAANQLINANLTLGTAIASNTTFQNLSTTNTLTLAGAISGGTGGIAAAKTITIAGVGAMTINGNISNGGASSVALTRTGIASAGLLTLGGNNSYSGGTIIGNGGTAAAVRVTHNSALGSGLVTMNFSGSVLELANGINIGNSLSIDNASTNKTLRLVSGATSGTYSGAINILETTLSNFRVNAQGGTFTLSGIVSGLTGTTGVQKQIGDTGTVILSNASNSYVGITEVFGGTLQFANNGAGNTTASVTVTNAGSTLAVNYGGGSDYTQAQVGTLLAKTTFTTNVTAFGFDTTNSSATYGAVLSIAAGVTKLGTNALTLDQANTYSGTTTLSAGQLNINNAGSGGTSSAIGTGALTIGAGTTIDNTTGGAITLSTNNAVNLNGDFSYGGTRDLNFGTGAVALTLPASSGTRTITLGGSGRTLTFGGAVTSSLVGGTTTVQVDGAGNTLVLGSLALNSNSAQARSNIWAGSANVTVNGAVTPGGFSTHTFTYQGTGTMTLNGSTSLNGLTTLNNASGTLTLAGNNSAGNGGVTLTAGTLNINNANALGAVGGTLTLTAGTINNTSGGAITNAVANPIALGGDFAFSTSSGTTLNSLNLGTGAVSIGGNRIITLNGAGALTLGGVMTNTGDAVRTLTVNNGAGTASTSALNLGGYALTGSGSTAARIDIINGSGNVNITGAVTNGVTAGSGLSYTGTGTLTLSGTGSSYTGTTGVNSTNGVIVGIGANAFGSTSGITVSSSTNILSLRGDSSTNFVKASDSSAYAVTTAASGATINVDQATGAGTSLKTMTIGTLALNPINGDNTTNFTGANNTSLSIGAVTTGAGTGSNSEIINNTISGGGKLTLASIAVNRVTAPTLSFTGSGNTDVTGAITAASAGTKVSVTSTGTVELKGNNTYTGLTTMNAATGTLTLSGNNSSATGGVTLTTGRLNINSTNALGATAGAFTLTAGTIDNTTGGTIINAGNNAINLNGDFTYGGTRDLNMGTGAVALANNGAGTRIITLGGSGRTLTFGGAVSTGSTANTTTFQVDGAGNTLVLGSLTLNGNSSPRDNIWSGSGNVTINGAVNSGGGGGANRLIYSGTGTMTLNGTNSSTGTTSVTSGELALNATSAQSITGNLTVSGGTAKLLQSDQINTLSTLTVSGGIFALNGFNQSLTNVTLSNGGLIRDLVGGGALTGLTNNFAMQDGTVSAILAGSVGLAKTTAGTVILSGNNTYTGATTIAAGGTLQIGAGSTTGSISTTSAVTNSGALIYNRSNDLTASYAIGGTGTLEKLGAGVLTLTNTNGYTGTTTITAGTLQLGDGTTGKDGTVASTSVVNNAALVYNRFGTATYGGVISGSGSVTKTGAGTQILTGTSTYNGATTITAGTLQLGDGTTGKDGTLANSLSIVNNASLVYNRFGTASYGGVISGNGTVTKTGAGTQILSGSNSYTGITTINAGTLRADVANGVGTGALGNGGNITFTGGTLQYTANSAGSDYSTGGRIKNSTSAVSLDDNGQSVTLAGAIDSSNVGGLTKAGMGTVNLNGANSYTGVTTVSAGTLKLGNAGALGATGVGNTTTVTAGATLALNGLAIGAEDVTLNGSGVGGAGALVNTNASAASLSGVVTLGSASSIGATGGNLTLSGALGGNFVLTKEGSGKLVLQTSAAGRTSSGSGTTTINGGVLRIENATALNTNEGNTNSNITINNTGIFELANGITHAQQTTLNNGGTIRSDGSNTETSKIFVGAGAAVTLSTVSASDVFSIGNGSNDVTAGDSSSVIRISGPGTVAFGNSNDYIGNWSLDSGTTQLNATAGAFGATTSGSVTLNGGQLYISSNSARDYTVGQGNNVVVSANSSIINDRVASGVALTHTFGNLSIGASTLTTQAGSNVTGGAAQTVVFGATTLTGNAKFNIVGGANNTNGNVTLGVVADGGSAFGITKLGDNTTSLTLTAAGSYTGGNTVGAANGANAGTLLATANSALGTAGALTVYGGTADITTTTQSISTLTLGGGASGSTATVNIGAAGVLNLGGNVTYNATNNPNGASISGSTGFVSLEGDRTFTVGDSSAAIDLTVSAIIQDGSGTRALTKQGSGTMAMTGANTYTGKTTVTAGTLKVDNNGSTTFGKITGSAALDSITVSSSGTLLLAGNGSADRLADSTGITLDGGTLRLDNAAAGLTETMGALTLTANSIIDFGSGGITSAKNILTFASITASDLTNFTLSIWNWSGTTINGGGDDQLKFSSVIGSISQSQLNNIMFYSNNGITQIGVGTSFDTGILPSNEFAPVPEPSTYIGGGLILGLAVWSQRKRLTPNGKCAA